MNTDDSIPTRQSLLSRLKNWDDQESWREFFDTYWQLIHRVARKAGLHEEESQDVVQEVILSVAKKMPSFQYNAALGSFRGWLFQLTRWRIITQFKKRGPQNAAGEAASHQSRADPCEELLFSSEEATPNMAEIADPAGFALEKLWDEEWQRHVLALACARVKTQISPSQYQMFDFHVNQRMSVAEVARTLGVSAAQIYLAKHRISGLLKKEVKRLERSECMNRR